MPTPSVTKTESDFDDLPAQRVLEGFARLHWLIVVSDREGRVRWLSDRLGLALGDRSDLIGHPIQGLFHSATTSSDPQDSAETCAFANAIAQELDRRQVVIDRRLELRHCDSEPRAVDVSAFRVEGASGAPLTVTIARPSRAAARRGSKADSPSEPLHPSLEASPDGVLLVDDFGFITAANESAARLLGREGGSLRDQPVSLFLADPAGVGGLIESLAHSGSAIQEEIEIVRRDGQRRWLTVSAHVQSESRESSRFFVMLRDVTESRAARRELERKNAELESYVHSVSHDLRSPLVSLLGFTRLLRKDYERDLDETGLHFLDRIEQAGRNMEQLLQDLLELSRIGQAGEYRVQVNPRPILLQLQAELKLALDAGGISLVLGEDLPSVLCDRTRLYQLFSNLIGNAIKHMGEVEKPEIRVDVQNVSEGTLINVSDNGRGVAPEDHEKIFEIFSTANRKGSGVRASGVGLAIVKKIAETGGGRVWLESAPGEGARFFVLLPRA